MAKLFYVTVVWCVLLFMALPTLVIILYSFYPSAYITFPPKALTLQWYSAVFAERELFLAPLLASLRLSLLATLVSAVIGTMAAFVLVRGDMPFRSSLNSIMLAPLLVPTLITGFGGMMILTKFGLLGTYWSLLLGHVVITTPFIIQSVTAALTTFNRTVEEAAISLGSSPRRAIRRVVLPVILPSVFSGAIFGFIISFDELPLTLLLSTPSTVTLPVQLYGYLQQRSDPTFAAISVMLLAVSLTALLATQKLGGMDKRLY